MKNLTVFLLVGACALAQTQPGPGALALMPWPSSVTPQSGSVAIDTNFSVSTAGAGASDPRVKDAVQRIFARLSRQTGMSILPHPVPAGQTATLSMVVEQRDHRAPQRLGDDERYSLEISEGHIRLSADQPLGALRGIETFLQLVQENAAASAPGFSAPAVVIRDEPRFPWRGLSLDVSRHFIPADGIKRTIDGLAAVKLNVLHWHLSDDQGFRVESKKYPRLQQFGSDGLYYTQVEIRDIVAYARERGVRIVPEFDMPGHATSWRPGYPKLGAGSGPYEIGPGYGILLDLMDPTQESTYRFLDGFVGEMAKLFPDEYFHIGGDEVNPDRWNQNPKIQAFMRKHHIADAKALQVYFNQHLLTILTKHGKRMEGWDEVLQPNLPKSIVIQSWRGQESLWQAAREGYQGILSAGYYLDHMSPASYHYAVDPMKLPEETKKRLERRGQPIPAELTPEEKKNVLGGEAAMWEELATAENIDAKLWPRLAAIAERFWSPESVIDITSMYQRLDMTNRWLEWLGLTQRTSLELMRQRLAGVMRFQTLDQFASILEPGGLSERHANKNSRFTPLNRLVDALSPESEAAREFRNTVDDYLAGKPAATALLIEEQLAEWSKTAREVRPMLEGNSILKEDQPVADALSALCDAGRLAVGHLVANSAATKDWKDRTLAALSDQPQWQADVRVAIAPAIQKLVQAVPVTQ